MYLLPQIYARLFFRRQLYFSPGKFRMQAHLATQNKSNSAITSVAFPEPPRTLKTKSKQQTGRSYRGFHQGCFGDAVNNTNLRSPEIWAKILTPMLQLKSGEKLTCKFRMNAIHFPSEAQENTLKMCLPAPPFFSIQEASLSKECALIPLVN